MWQLNFGLKFSVSVFGGAWHLFGLFRFQFSQKGSLGAFENLMKPKLASCPGPYHFYIKKQHTSTIQSYTMTLVFIF